MSIISRFIDKGLSGSRLSVFFMLALLASSPSLAEKWYFEPKISTRLGYNDNLQLSTDSEIHTYTSNITADAALGFRTNVSDVSITAKMIDRRFDDHAYLNTNNQFLKLQASTRSGRNLFGLGADYQRESARTTEFDFTGYSATNKKRITKSISPYWERELTELTTLRIGGSYSDVTYQDAEFTRLNDYIDKSSYASLQHLLSNRTSVRAVLSKSLYESDVSEHDSTSLQLGINHMLSETLSVDLMFGPNYTKSKQISASGEEEGSDVGRLLDLGFTKEFELTTLNGSIVTSESAGGAGRMTRRTSLNMSVEHSISPRTTFTLSGLYQENESAGGVAYARSDRTFMRFEPKLSWQATPWWTITGSYRYQESENDSSARGPAKSNAVFLTLKYVWPKESYSKWMGL